MDILDRTRLKLLEIMKENQWEDESVEMITADALSGEEAIGYPDREDYPLLDGLEYMVEVTFKGIKAHAYTDHIGRYQGTLNDVLNLPLSNNFERAVFVATTNVVLRYLGKIDKTIHCLNGEPSICALNFVNYIKEHYGNPRIAFIGLQPGMVSELCKHYKMRIVDLDVNNIDKEFGEVVVEDISHTREIIDWSDLIIATGSTVVNDTIGHYLVDKPTIFYGVTIAGVAYLNGLKRFCFCGH